MIRTATLEDLPECSQVIRRVIEEIESKYYSTEIISKWCEYNSFAKLKSEFKTSTFMVYEDKVKIVGVGAIENAHLKKVYVLSEYQSRGIGKSLLQALEQIARENEFELVELNSTSNAIGFYQAQGYTGQEPITIVQDGLSVTFTRMTKKVCGRQGSDLRSY